MLAEIGLVGRALGRYDLYLGGNRGERAFLASIKRTSPLRRFSTTLTPC